ncbi:hypothetical protein VTN00DRAFT_5522 [Thermoascus crustaceus]|uniref:uncharacterized protein n=1 Tax=Thermoascus crustaceus TaxID=5088 RepID=UPI003742AE17
MRITGNTASLTTPKLVGGEAPGASLAEDGDGMFRCPLHPKSGAKGHREDVMQVDIEVQVNGWIVDRAFTMTLDPVYDYVVAAVKDATNTGVKYAGIDARMSNIDSAIREAMEIYEVKISEEYRIHGKKTVPFVKNSDQMKMEGGD